ncbi:hypothetical protein HC251_16660 [Iamia sp. SCSIO 61187]|uniref:hypothetical protein n=1 Tax=Iamia sp. SCSIO 61187 TaxID=2722752 RepID=UPI001C636AA3|nr:hypothetical protein [Iamia sp. SCSIO 61187]QYG93900.1 hypothetical protein HC251_16660 [Iamia sp. SCSIO 61187]
MPSCPVTFDFASAELAAAECRRHAGYLASLREARARARTTAVEDWSGRFRDDFDRDFTTSQQALQDEVERLRTLAGAIDDAAAEARVLKTTCERDHDHSAPPGGPDRNGPR